MKRLLIALVSLLLATLPGMRSVSAHEGSHAAGKVELGASLAISPTGQFFAVTKETAGKESFLVLRSSADQGQSWGEPVRVNAVSEPIAASGDAYPKLAVGAKGEVYLAWTRPLSKPYTGEIRFARSLDGGKTFSAPITVHRDKQEITHRFESMALAKNGDIYIAWIDKRDLELAKQAGKSYRGAGLYAAVSRNAGASFEREFKLADHSCECCRIAMAADASGGVWAFWRHVFEPNIRDHALLKINAAEQQAPIRRATFDNWRIDACPHQGPSLMQDEQGTLHAVWFTQGDKPGVNYGRLREGAVEGQRRIGNDTAAHADIATQGKRIAIVWKDFDGKATRLLALQSADLGQTWSEETVLATAKQASDQARVIAHKGQFFVLWNTQEQALRVMVLP